MADHFLRNTAPKCIFFVQTSSAQVRSSSQLLVFAYVLSLARYMLNGIGKWLFMAGHPLAERAAMKPMVLSDRHRSILTEKGAENEDNQVPGSSNHDSGFDSSNRDGDPYGPNLDPLH